MRSLVQILNTAGLEIHFWFSAGCLRTRVSWLLLMLVALSLLTMPLTQGLWTWDGFLHGGQDFETGAFLILVTFCLAVVLARSGKACLARMLASLRVLAFLAADASGPASPSFLSLLPVARSPFVAACNLPLQI